jgi:hypothetical protein
MFIALIGQLGGRSLSFSKNAVIALFIFFARNVRTSRIQGHCFTRNPEAIFQK